jgi:hypothetical protein
LRSRWSMMFVHTEIVGADQVVRTGIPCPIS